MSTAAQEAPAERLPARRLVPGTATSALRLIGIIGVAASLAMGSIEWGRVLVENSPAAAPGVAMVLLSQLVPLGAMFLRRPSVSLPWLPLALLVAGMAQTSVVADPVLVTHWLPGYWVLAPLALALLMLSPPGYVLFALLEGSLVATAILSTGRPDARLLISDVAFTVQPVAEMVLFGHALRLISAARDRSLRRHEEAALHRADEELESSSREEANRLLHDHLLHALHALGRTHQQASRSQLEEECRVAHRAMNQRAPGVGPTHIETLLQHEATAGTLAATVTGSGPPLPTHVASALVAAVHAAAPRVQRSPERPVTVVVGEDAGSVVVQLCDDQCSFRPAHRASRVSPPGETVLELMDDIGGDVDTEATPSGGVRLSLRWPSRPDAQARRWRRGPDDRARAALTRAAWPGLVIGILMTLLWAPFLDPAWLGHLTALATLSVGVAGAVVLARRPLRFGGITVLLVSAIAGWVANLWLLPDRPHTFYLFWMAWAASALVHLVVLSSRLSFSVVILLGWATVLCTALLVRFPQASPLWFAIMLIVGVLRPGMAVVALMVTHHAVAQDAQVTEHTTQARIATARMQHASELDQYWSSKVTMEAMPLIEAVAEGLVDPTDESVRDRALAIEAALRDELVLGPRGSELAPQLAHVRSRGWTVRSTLTPDDSDEAIARACQLLELLGEPVEPGQLANLSSTATRTSLVVFDASPEQMAHWAVAVNQLEGRYEADPDFVRLGLFG
ncbi:hypothetical protein ACTQ49_10460 [Luteococcus sp. Sow4_B9]|uniref:hypothetical protein n=1 Tax=Luteococcus sp. Sow4_B9 TaxID=3438792 RepID=UPI003F99F0CA